MKNNWKHLYFGRARKGPRKGPRKGLRLNGFVQMELPLQGVLGAESLGEGGAPKSTTEIEGRGKAFPPLRIVSAVLLAVSLSLSALSEVVCVWSNGGYDCSGTGSEILVQGGGGISVTNGMGTCIDCSAISPTELMNLAEYTDAEAKRIESNAEHIKGDTASWSNSVQQLLDEIGEYRTFNVNLGTGSGAQQTEWQQVTNYMATTRNYQTQSMNEVNSQIANNVGWAIRGRILTGVANGVYDYANRVALPYSLQTIDTLSHIDTDVDTILDSSYFIQSVADQLRAGAVECIPSGSGGSTNSTPGSGSTELTGNWCTYEQGEALKSLLGELRQALSRQESLLHSVSNYTQDIRQTLKSGLFSQYTAIPEAATLGDWKQVYLSGQETNWGYSPTNTLQRIELLLYGLSGVGTNTDSFSQAAYSPDELDEDMTATADDQKGQIEAISTDADDTVAQSLGQNLVRFFRALRPQENSFSAGEVFIPSVSIRIGTGEGSQLYVPALQLTTESNVASTVGVCHHLVSTVASVFWYVTGGFFVFLYWRWFCGVAASLVKWAVELVSSLFAS